MYELLKMEHDMGWPITADYLKIFIQVGNITQAQANDILGVNQTGQAPQQNTNNN